MRSRVPTLMRAKTLKTRRLPVSARLCRIDCLADAVPVAPKKKTRITKKKDEDEDDEEEESEPEEEEEEDEEPEAEDDEAEDANGTTKKAPGAEKGRKVKPTKSDEPVPVVADKEADD